MELFDINKKVFDKQGWDQVSNSDKKRNFFMLNRFFSIAYPMQANILQHLRINQSAVIDFWHLFLSSKYDKVPFWIYIKGVKKSEEIKTKKINISKETVKQYCIFNKIDPKIAEDAILHFPNQFANELKQFEKLTKQK